MSPPPPPSSSSSSKTLHDARPTNSISRFFQPAITKSIQNDDAGLMKRRRRVSSDHHHHHDAGQSLSVHTYCDEQHVRCVDKIVDDVKSNSLDFDRTFPLEKRPKGSFNCDDDITDDGMKIGMTASRPIQIDEVGMENDNPTSTIGGDDGGTASSSASLTNTTTVHNTKEDEGPKKIKPPLGGSHRSVSDCKVYDSIVSSAQDTIPQLLWTRTSTDPPSSSFPTKKENPFAKFACSTSTTILSSSSLSISERRSASKNVEPSSHKKWHIQQPSIKSVSNVRTTKGVKRSAAGMDAMVTATTKQQPQSSSASSFVRMKDLPREEQTRIVQKWHSMVVENNDDGNDEPTSTQTQLPLEVRRFQVLLAATLHARCQEQAVRKAMAALRTNLSSWKGGGQDGLTVDTIAHADPKMIATCISNLQYYNVKARHIVTAAQEIQSMFGGVVPEDEESLLRITGIGKVFADLLAFVNTREMYQSTE